MSGFSVGFARGYAQTRFGGLSLYSRGLGYAMGEAVIGSPLFSTAYADLDSPSGFSSVIPFVDYALNAGYRGGFSGINPFVCGLGFGGYSLGFNSFGLGYGCGCLGYFC